MSKDTDVRMSQKEVCFLHACTVHILYVKHVWTDHRKRAHPGFPLLYAAVEAAAPQPSFPTNSYWKIVQNMI